MNREDRRALRTIDEVSAGLPTIECQRKCQGCCGPVMMSGPEWRRIIERLGREPRGEDLTCPMLCRTSGLCTVYDIRPIICRLWGLTPKLACPHGCKPSRWLTDIECSRIIGRVMRAGEHAEK